MKDIPESEALSKLNSPKRCVDCSWQPLKTPSHSMTASVGLIDSNGTRIGLLAELIYQNHPLVGTTTYKFGVFSQHPYGLQRVYMLEIRQFKKPIKNTHQLPHEHIGDKRVNGSDIWATWGYYDVLKHFCNRTNITFDPDLLSPTAFELK